MLYKTAMQMLDEYVAGRHGGNVSAAARALNMNPPAFGRWVNRERTPNAEDLFTILDRLGARLLPAGETETAREVCFVDARVVEAGANMPPPESERYVAVPMVGEVGAGPGIIPEEDLKSWILVYRDHPSVARRANLLAVEVGRNQRSMTPTLFPGDIILVDRDDWGTTGYKPPGNIYLVREPGQEGGGMVKRVAISGLGDYATITFYSDNPEYEPETFHMSQYDSDYRKAIVGKVVWAWSDLSRK